jgi:hypothetical protein
MDEQVKKALENNPQYQKATEEYEQKLLKRQHKKFRQLFGGAKSFNPKRIQERQDFYGRYKRAEEQQIEEQQKTEE